jgi:hypothetical protein
VTQRQRLQPIAPILGGFLSGVVLFFVGRALEHHFAFNAAICNTFNSTTAGCAGNTFLYDMGGVVEYLGIFLGIAGILAGLGLSVSARNQTRPAAGRPASDAASSPSAPLTAGQIPAPGTARTGSRPTVTRPSSPSAMSHPPAAGLSTQPGPTGPASSSSSSSSAVPAAWTSTPSPSAPPLPEQSDKPLQSGT